MKNIYKNDFEDEMREELKEVAPSLSHISLSITEVASQKIISEARMTTNFVEYLTDLNKKEAVKHIKEALEDKIQTMMGCWSIE